VLECLLRTIRSTDGDSRVVIVSNFTQTLDEIQRLLALRKYRYLRIDGELETDKRQRYVNHFNR
jgi:SNF2 family DNA or RNA helicase